MIRQVPSRMVSIVLVACCAPPVQAEPFSLRLWPDDHPANAPVKAEPAEELPNRPVVRSQPELVVYLPKENPTGTAVMICPGGGYARLAIDHEGTQVAQWLRARGIAAMVLKYRCGGEPNLHPAPLEDALRGMRHIRSRAAEWKLDATRIGVIGFSAGGHLASCVSTLADDGRPGDDPLDAHSSRANFAVLVYPVISMEEGVGHAGSQRNLLGAEPDRSLTARLSTYKRVSKQTPPTLLVHASDDTSVLPDNALLYYRALLTQQVPAELHIYERGGHGFGMRTTGLPVDGWRQVVERWLISRDLLADHPGPDE